MTRDIRLIVLGAGGVGKSALTVQFVQNVYVQNYDPTIEDSYRKLVEVNNDQFMLEIIDTAGTEQFRSMRDMYMKNGQGFIMVYSITAQSTYNEIHDLVQNIYRVKETEDIPIVVAANKCDLEDERVITTNQGEELAKKYSAHYFETSAKVLINVNEIYHKTAELISEQLPKLQKKKTYCTLF